MDTSNNTAVILAIVSLLGTVVTVVVGWFKDKKKSDVDAASRLIEAALALNKQELQTIRDTNTQLVKEKTELEAMDELHKRVDEQYINKIGLLERIVSQSMDEISALKKEVVVVKDELNKLKEITNGKVQ